MPRAVVLTTTSKANLTGGTFADTLTANANDAVAVANFDSGGARILEAWAIDSDSVAELQVIYTRPESTHDQAHGFRAMIPALTPGGAAAIGAHSMLPGLVTIDLFKSDSPTIQVSGTAADDVIYSWITEYDDLPGVSAVMANWAQIQALQLSAVGIRCDAVASATPGAYGASRAINADDDRLHANTWYAILGASVQTQVTTIGITGPDWGGQRIGLPSGALDLRSNTWFVDQAIKWNKPLIPCFNSNNKGNILTVIADAEANTSPKVDWFLYELTAKPGV